MDSFDLGRLTDHDFEEVCKDLFEDILECPLEIFTAGRDDGVDLRYSTPGEPDVSTIIQCKHWINSGWPKLVSHMTRDELPKIQKLQPRRYILVASTKLTKLAKDRLFDTLSPFVLAKTDIYGLDELVAELRKRPELVRRHLRLWLSSSAVLGALLNHDIHERSLALLDELSTSTRVYVPNASFGRAQDLLEDVHVCLISGSPGIGKSTLARVLAAAYAANGFELIEISEDANEANRVWDTNKPQFFYYDDFLGQSSLEEKLNKNEDNRLLALLGRVAKSPNKRFVLTTRTYILNQARQRYERLSRHNFDPATCVVNLNDYTPLVRARILYNHLYYSSLTTEQRRIFALEENYSRVLRHDSFNPRLIALSLELGNWSGNVSAYDAMMANLKNPADLWQHIVDYDLSEAAICLIEVLVSLDDWPRIAEVRAAWEGYCEKRGVAVSQRIFRTAVSVVENTMIRIIDFSVGEQAIVLHDPSVSDYLENRLAGDVHALGDLIASATSVMQVAQLWSAAASSEVPGFAAAVRACRSQVRDALGRELAAIEVKHDVWRRSAPWLSQKPTWLRRLTSVLELASIFDLGDTVSAALDKLAPGWTDEVVNSDDIVGLATVMSKFDQGSQAAARATAMYPEMIEWIVADVSGWSLASSAEEQLRQLSDLEIPGVSSALSRIEQHLHDIAERELERWQEERGDRSTDLDEVASIVAFAEGISNAEEWFPGLLEARQAVHDHRVEEREMERLRYEKDEADEDDVDSNDERSRTANEIRELFSLLRDQVD